MKILKSLSRTTKWADCRKICTWIRGQVVMEAKTFDDDIAISTNHSACPDERIRKKTNSALPLMSTCQIHVGNTKHKHHKQP
ncbi:hypothetical protein LINGRAHAP2_LOCUS28215 [Linum grandiflorum]